MGVLTGLLTGIFEKREKRDLTAKQWLTDWLGGAEANSGIRVNQDNAIKYTAVFACQRLLSETIASLPLFVYQRLERGKRRANEHWLYDILHLQPNEVMSSFSFREMMTLHLIGWGNFYGQLEISGNGNIAAIWPLLPWKMSIVRDDTTGELSYRYTLPDNRAVILDPSTILHIPGFSFDGRIGKSLITIAREAIGLGLAMEEFSARFFGQGTQFGGFLEHPKSLTDKSFDNLKASLQEKYEGVSKAHKLFILEEGMQYKPATMPLDDMQFLESKKFQVEEIARIFNIPPHMIKNLDRATFNNIEHLSLEFVIYTLRPWLVRIEQSLNIRLFTKTERKQYFVEFLVDGLLRGDLKSRYEAYAIGKQWGWLSTNKILELENQNPEEGPAGDMLWMPLNMIDANQAREIYKPKEPTASQASQKALPIVEPTEVRMKELRSATFKLRLANSWRSLFADATLRIVQFEKKDILRKAKEIFAKRSQLAFDDFIEDYYNNKVLEIDKRFRKVTNTYGKTIYEAALDEINSNLDKSKEVEKFLSDYQDALTARYITSSRAQLKDKVKNAIQEETDPVEALTKEFENWEEVRPDKVSLKETVKIAGAVSLFTYKVCGIRKLIWVNAGGTICPFCERMNGKVVGIEQPFMTKDNIMEAEGHENLTFSTDITHPPLHQTCVCMIQAG